MTVLGAELKKAAQGYFNQGWLAMPLTLDPNGYPKKPMVVGWTKLQPSEATVNAMPWEQATGIGIILGAVSHNLAVLDIDDVALAQATIAELKNPDVLTRATWTVRKRCHLFFIEKAASASTRFFCTWEGREIGIELKANGTQVATVPTPGYELAIDADPMNVPTIELAWLSVCRRLGIITKATSRGGPANYPPPWQTKVPKGERNQAFYIEAHKLREAGMNLDTALEIMQARYETHYAQGELSWHELQATVESAYHKGTVSGGEIKGEADEHSHLNVTRRPRSTGDTP